MMENVLAGKFKSEYLQALITLGDPKIKYGYLFSSMIPLTVLQYDGFVALVELRRYLNATNIAYQCLLDRYTKSYENS